MALNETKRTSAKLKYAGATKDVMSAAKQVACVCVCVSLLFCLNFMHPSKGVDILHFCIYSCKAVSIYLFPVVLHLLITEVFTRSKRKIMSTRSLTVYKFITV